MTNILLGLLFLGVVLKLYFQQRDIDLLFKRDGNRLRELQAEIAARRSQNKTVRQRVHQLRERLKEYATREDVMAWLKMLG